jgi:hypothetical protein
MRESTMNRSRSLSSPSVRGWGPDRCCFLAALFLSLVFVNPADVRADDASDGFRSIFDGKTLEGWSAPDLRYWSIEDEAITARSSKDVPCTQNQFLVWQGGDLDDFELELEFRILGDASANSGIQFRSKIAPDGHAIGYQADMDRAKVWLGALYDEHTRRTMLAKRGERVEIDTEGRRVTIPLAGGGNVPFDADGWNRYRIVARGPQIRLEVNGETSSEVVDRETKERDLTGRLALQIHSGPPMTVQFRSIRLKRLPLADGRKKIVFVAGHPSHPSGQHEFNGGVALLTRRLATVESVVATAYHDGGWPKDPSAFDNANGIVIYADGGGGHPVAKHLAEMDELMKRGVGLLCMHYAVEIPKGPGGESFLRWIGGFYEDGYSSNPHWDAKLEIRENHPITRGVAGATIHDEWYFSIRFRENEDGVVPLLRAKPDEKARSMNGWPRRAYPHVVAAAGRAESLMWAIEREDGGRGVGFTGGHWHRNWAFDTQRRVILNAALWIAGAEVPEGGVDSAAVTQTELEEGLDPKGDKARIPIPEGAATKE